VHFQLRNLHPERAGGRRDLAHFLDDGAIAGVTQDRQAAKAGDDFTQEFKTFAA
jgi:hypothetical protein